MRHARPASGRPGRLGLLALATLTAITVLVVGALPAAALARAQYPVVALGSRGADVLTLQRLLRQSGREVAANGVFDTATRDQLVAFQRSAGLTNDGVARPPTWRALAPRLARGAQGEAVRAVQEQLNTKRSAGLAVNGTFDVATEQAVMAFQRRVGLARTGVVDADSWRHLVWLFMRPRTSDALCGYEIVERRSAKWGTAGAIAQVERAAQLYRSRTGSRLAVGDISLELGGNISGHATHEVGLDVDVRPARKDGRECRWGIAYTMRSYDRVGTRALIRAIHDAAPGRVKLIYFNDPVLVAEGLVRRYPHHDAHLHVRYCEVDHSDSRYRCPGAARAAEASTALEPSLPEPAPADGPSSTSRARAPGPRSFWAV